MDTHLQPKRMTLISRRSDLTFDDATWDVLLKKMAAAGMNMVIIDLGDGIQYESHPEIAVNMKKNTGLMG